jgi:ABC-type Zn2+ transport system substrate-binding protein/surface adhesin
MNYNRFFYRAPIDQLINLLQEIPFLGSAHYIVFWKAYTYYFNAIDLKHNYSIRLISPDYNRAKLSSDNSSR